MCVSCGALQAAMQAPQARAASADTGPGAAGVELIRFYVVPHAFRTHFPEAAKAHCHHDILLLCRACFDSASAAVALRRDELLATVMDRGLVSQTARAAAAFVVDREEEEAHRAAKALDKLFFGAGTAASSARIPAKRRQELLAVLGRYFGTSTHSGTDTSRNDMLLLVRKGLALQPRRRNDAFVPPERRVVERFCSVPESIGTSAGAAAGEDGHLCHQGGQEEQRPTLQRFIEGWRQLFIDTLHPRHLPAGWSVHHQREGRHRLG